MVAAVHERSSPRAPVAHWEQALVVLPPLPAVLCAQHLRCTSRMLFLRTSDAQSNHTVAMLNWRLLTNLLDDSALWYKVLPPVIISVVDSSTERYFDADAPASFTAVARRHL